MSSPDALRSFRAARWVGASLLVVTVALFAILPNSAGSLAPGFRTPILAFELARSHGEIESLFGEPGSAFRAELVRRMDLGNEVDYLFMVAYSGLLSLFALGLARESGRRYLLSAFLSPLAALADAAENLQLFAITRRLGGDYEEALARLGVFTWLKWGGLAFALAWLSPALFRGAPFERVVGAISLFTGLLALGAIVDRAHFAELFSLFISLAFIGIWVIAFRRTGRSGG